MVRHALGAFVAALTGAGASSNADLAQGVHTAIGVAALSDIKTDFVRKARGGVGEDGVKWPKLSPKTLAYGRRFGPGEKSALKGAAGLGRQHSQAPGGNEGLLTKGQLKRWRFLFASMAARFAADMPVGEAKAKAAAIAWTILKREGARTMLEVYGHRDVEILRDTGVLLNSLSPGTVGAGGAYQKPTGDGGQEQIFELIRAGVIVGTSVAYAAVHQNGGKGIPARPFLPVDGIPQVWANRWLAAAVHAISSAFRIAIERAAA